MTDKEFAALIPAALSPRQLAWLRRETACGSSARRAVGRAISIAMRLSLEEQEEVLKHAVPEWLRRVADAGA